MPVTKLCVYCNSPFSREPKVSEVQRFCSKKCWYVWHQKKNHQQYNRIISTCDHCGNPTNHTPSQYAKCAYHYCSDKCARIASSAKRSGKNSANWKGGGIESRGSNWPAIRESIIAAYGYKCAECGMSNDEHNVTYHKNLHVHHITPYRLTLDNSPSNLAPLCIPCHLRVEAALNTTLTPLELLLMKKNTEVAQLTGVDKKRDRSVPCPTCDGRKQARAKTCKKCWAKKPPTRNPPRPNNYCADCGIVIAENSTTCRQCYNNRRAAPIPGICPDCGDQMKTPRSKRCRPCQARLNGLMATH